MSIRSLAALAVARDKAPPGEVAGGGRGQAATMAAGAPAPGAPPGVAGGAGAEVGAPPSRGGVPQQFADVLISAIPTEPLAAYTALVGVTAAALDGLNGRAYLPYRWWAYLVFLAVIPVAVWLAYTRASRAPTGTGAGNRRRFPGAEALAAMVAGAAWGLAMPGSPLEAQLTGTARTLAAATVVTAAAAALTLIQAPQLKAASGTPGERGP